MTESKIASDVWTDSDNEALYAVIGKYLIIFQWIESLLDSILLLSEDYENLVSNRAKLASMTNERKVDVVKETVLTSPVFARVHTRPQWCAMFEYVIECLHKERVRRNEIVHSQYLFDFTKIGCPPLRSFQRKTKEVVSNQWLTKEAQTQLLRELAQLAVDVNFVYVQLVADHRAPLSPIENA